MSTVALAATGTVEISCICVIDGESIATAPDLSCSGACKPDVASTGKPKVGASVFISVTVKSCSWLRDAESTVGAASIFAAESTCTCVRTACPCNA